MTGPGGKRLVELGPILVAPPSLNRTGSRGHWRAWHGARKRWGRLLAEELLVAWPARPSSAAEAVIARGRIRFAVNRRRDEGNFRSLLEKALGDVLVSSGRIPDDTPDRYRFDRLELEHDPKLREHPLAPDASTLLVLELLDRPIPTLEEISENAA